MEPNQEQNTQVKNVGQEHFDSNIGQNNIAIGSMNSSGNTTLQAAPTKKNHKTGVILGFVLLFLIAAGGVVFGVWEMMESENQRRQYETEINTLKEQNTKLSEETEKTSDEETEEDVVVVEMDAWDTFVENAKNKSFYAFGNNLTAFSADGKMSILNSSGEIFKMDDVIAVYEIEVGNGSVPYFYAIRSDGSVYRANLYETGITFEKVGDYTRIVSVVQSGDLYALLIDIDGNIYKVV